jgi:hypothetical protein
MWQAAAKSLQRADKPIAKDSGESLTFKEKVDDDDKEAAQPGLQSARGDRGDPGREDAEPTGLAVQGASDPDREVEEVGYDKELMPMKKDQVDLENAFVWIPDSKTANGIAEVPLTEIAVAAFRDQLALAGKSPYLFPNESLSGHQKSVKEVREKAFGRRFAESEGTVLPDLRSAFHVCDQAEGDAKVFKKYSQMKLQMKREALRKMNRQANEG